MGKPCFALINQLLCQFLCHLLAQCLKKSIILPERKFIALIPAKPSLCRFADITAAGRAGTNDFAFQLHQHIGGKLPLIGVGNLYTASQAAEALATGWAEFIALGKTLLINPHWAELTEQGRDDDIQTEIDPERAESYRLPARMLNLTLQGTQAWLPPVQGMERKGLDIFAPTLPRPEVPNPLLATLTPHPAKPKPPAAPACRRMPVS